MLLSCSVILKAPIRDNTWFRQHGCCWWSSRVICRLLLYVCVRVFVIAPQKKRDQEKISETKVKSEVIYDLRGHRQKVNEKKNYVNFQIMIRMICAKKKLIRVVCVCVWPVRVALDISHDLLQPLVCARPVIMRRLCWQEKRTFCYYMGCNSVWVRQDFIRHLFRWFNKCDKCMCECILIKFKLTSFGKCDTI